MTRELVRIEDTTANPAPLGLIGFGMTTILLNLHNAGLFELNAMIIAMGMFIGGFGQVVVGVMEWKKGNTFGTTAFGAYGFFWISLVAIWLLPKMGIATAPDAFSMGCYLSVWGLFTLAMFICTLKMNNITKFVFGSLLVLFALLAIGDFTGIKIIKTIAGIEGIICGLSAFYAAVAPVINEVYGKPICKV